MNAPTDLVAIPPLYRTITYYVLACALVVISALVGAELIDPLYLTIVAGIGGVFFGVAGSNVRTVDPTTDGHNAFPDEVDPLPGEGEGN